MRAARACQRAGAVGRENLGQRCAERRHMHLQACAAQHDGFQRVCHRRRRATGRGAGTGGARSGRREPPLGRQVGPAAPRRAPVRPELGAPPPGAAQLARRDSSARKASRARRAAPRGSCRCSQEVRRSERVQATATRGTCAAASAARVPRRRRDSAPALLTRRLRRAAPDSAAVAAPCRPDTAHGTLLSLLGRAAAQTRPRCRW